MTKPPYYPDRNADKRGELIGLILFILLMLLFLLSGCCRKPITKTPVEPGDTVTVIVGGTPVSFIRIDSGATVDLRSRRRDEVIWPEEERPKPPRRSGPLIVINKDKSRTTVVSGDGNNVSEGKIKDKSDDTTVRGDGNVTADKIKAPAVIGDGNRLDESNGLNPLWLLLLLGLIIAFFIWRKTK